MRKPHARIIISIVFMIAILLAGICFLCSCLTSSDKDYVLKYSSNDVKYGCIRGQETQSVLQGCDGTVVTADLYEGYFFSGWSDGVTPSIRQDLNVQNDIIVIAIFEKIMYSLKYEESLGGVIQGKNNKRLITARTQSQLPLFRMKATFFGAGPTK